MGRDRSMPSEIDALIEAMNAELVMGHWHAVVVYASTLQAHALALGEVQPTGYATSDRTRAKRG